MSSHEVSAGAVRQRSAVSALLDLGGGQASYTVGVTGAPEDLVQRLVRATLVPTISDVAPDYWLHVVDGEWQPGKQHRLATSAGDRHLWVRPGVSASWLQCRGELDAGAFRLALAHALARSGGACVHGAAVVRPGHGVAMLVLGPSGSGKSTVAAGVVAAGGRVVSDDTVRIWRRGSSSVRVAPFRRDLLLRGRAATMLREAVDAPVERCREGDDPRWRLSRSAAPQLFEERAEVRLLVVLEPGGWHGALSVAPLTMGERLTALMAAVHPFVLRLELERQRTVALLTAVAERIAGVRLVIGPDLTEALRRLG